MRILMRWMLCKWLFLRYRLGMRADNRQCETCEYGVEGRATTVFRCVDQDSAICSGRLCGHCNDMFLLVFVHGVKHM